ncbi:MAG: DUF3846 domain-containing protein [Clostridia bacterium]|nr:DUF3846 domain-containing protein [Clostridia bacterium]
MDRIKVIIVEPNKKPYISEIDNTLEKLQEIVGGFIDILKIENGVDLIINDEGKINNLPPNRYLPNDFIAGTFIIAGGDNETGETISLSDDVLEKYIDYFSIENTSCDF